MKNFFIKSGYINNQVQKYDTKKRYWTSQRIKASRLFQYSVYIEIKKFINYSEKSKLVDIGCGAGEKLKLLKDDKQNLEIFGIDTKESIDICKKNLDFGNFIVDDLSNYNESLYENHKNSFDYIICSDVIEHIKNPDQLLSLVNYLAHKDTIIIISTPDRIKFRGQSNNQSPNSAHIREWSGKELKLYLESKNFSVIGHKFMLPVKVSFTKVFFNEVIKRVIYMKNIFYNQVIMLNLDRK